jgi:CMP-N-acetylneuraminic acid synthetase
LPLIAWSILQTKKSNYVDEVYVSSDSEEILIIAKKSSAKVIRGRFDIW